MRVYLLRPIVDVFDGTGAPSGQADAALATLSGLVAKHLREGGDNTHHAVVWDGPNMLDREATIVRVADEESLIAIICRLLDPHNFAGGAIRSILNCRVATFGQDGQTFLCLRSEDSMPELPPNGLFTIESGYEWLTETDLFDGCASD